MTNVRPVQGAVSYTHLDVYKRQVSGKIKRTASNPGTGICGESGNQEDQSAQRGGRKMRRGTKIQKLKQVLPGIVKDVRHYAKPRVKLHNEGLGDYYTEGYRSLNQREWKGVRDTAYDFASWLKVYGYMAVTLGRCV